MGGVDKGLVAFRGQPMIGHVLSRFTPQVDRVVLNVNRSHDQYAAFGAPLVSDALTGFAGPLAGLAAGMQYVVNTFGAVSTDWVATAPCDSPFLPTDVVARLADAAHRAGSPIAVARTASGAQPVFALYRVAVLPSLLVFLAAGRRKIDAWTSEHAPAHVDFADEAAFANINTEGELRAL
jgi:molybdenum cofactor guanylyltransferase